jgi:hypothetical protein
MYLILKHRMVFDGFMKGPFKIIECKIIL